MKLNKNIETVRNIIAYIITLIGICILSIYMLAYMTQEQKLNSIIDGTYTLLQRSLDRDYGITDFIYNQYYKMVYGRSQASTVASNI